MSPTGEACKIQGHDIVDPTAELEHLYVLEEDATKVREYGYEESKGGKWILFILKSTMFSMWKKSCSLYRSGKLEGIKSLKASTGKKNPRSSATNGGVIIFHCGPYDQENLIRRYGENIVQLLNYSNDEGFVSYKTDEQTALGTRATGRRCNHLYRITVPQKLIPCFQPKRPREWSNSPDWRYEREGEPASDQNHYYNYETEQDSFDALSDIPSARFDVLWLNEPKFRSNYHLGYWMMVVPKTQLDETWEKATELFREEGLPCEIKGLSVSTSLQIGERFTGLVKFFVEIVENIDDLKIIGRTLAMLMDHSNKTGRMSFLRNGKTVCYVEVERRDLRYYLSRN